MKPIPVLGVVGVAALVALAPITAQMPAPSSSTFVQKAGASDLYERESSQLVLQTTRNAKVRAFARRMIADHTQSTNDVKAAAMRAHMRVTSPRLDPTQSRNLAALRGSRGTARDALYVRQQKPAHQMALQLMQSYATSGSVPSLRMAARNIAPVVQSHIRMLSTM